MMAYGTYPIARAPYGSSEADYTPPPSGGTTGIKLGSTTINKIYLGTTEIKKVYLGSTVVYDKTGA